MVEELVKWFQQKSRSFTLDIKLQYDTVSVKLAPPLAQIPALHWPCYATGFQTKAAAA